jgi:hypothetical protein
MSAAALIYLGLMLLGLGMVLAKDGKPRTGNHSFFWSLSGIATQCALLYWGGFFAAHPRTKTGPRSKRAHRPPNLR